MATSLAALALCHGLSCCAQWSMPLGQGRRLGKAHSIGFLRLYPWAVGRMPTGAWPSHNRLWARLRAFRTGPCPVNPSAGRATLPTTADKPPQRTTGERMSATHGLRNKLSVAYVRDIDGLDRPSMGSTCLTHSLAPYFSSGYGGVLTYCQLYDYLAIRIVSLAHS